MRVLSIEDGEELAQTAAGAYGHAHARPCSRSERRDGKPAPVLVLIGLLWLALSCGASPAAAAAAPNARVSGTFAMRATVTSAVDVSGEYSGETLSRRWVIVPDACTRNVCSALQLDRQRGDGLYSAVTLRRRGPGTYSGSGVFYAALECRHRGKLGPIQPSVGFGRNLATCARDNEWRDALPKASGMCSGQPLIWKENGAGRRQHPAVPGAPTDRDTSGGAVTTGAPPTSFTSHSCSQKPVGILTSPCGSPCASNGGSRCCGSS